MHLNRLTRPKANMLCRVLNNTDINKLKRNIILNEGLLKETALNAVCWALQLKYNDFY